jgi:GTP-binding protein Era
MSEDTTYKSGYIAIVGQPNVGKSTLMNCLVGERLSIVTPKPQTTRTRVLGIVSGEGYQMIVLDTPGLLDPKYPLQEAMVKTIKAAVDDADLVLLLVDARGDAKPDLEKLLPWVRKKPLVVGINKIDLVQKEVLLPLISGIAERAPRAEIVPFSALTRFSVEELRKVLLRLLPAGSPFYPGDQLTEHPERFFAAELIREQVFLTTGDEIPYSTAVLIEEFKENTAEGGKKDFIRATIYVEKENQKAILIGKDGRGLKRIGSRARTAIESLTGRPVYLELWVKVKPGWRKSRRDLQELGYL